MAILVAGGAGYIGSHMVWELLDAGEEVVALDRLSTGFDWAVSQEAKLVTGDVGDIKLVGAVILAALDGVAASTGSACHSGKVELSPVLQAMSVPPEVGIGAIRFSLGRGTTAEEIEIVLDRLKRVLG
jgi:NAD(P)-dependent dehydrogenase (short-subunit alcohol dehydrogenase family)